MTRWHHYPRLISLCYAATFLSLLANRQIIGLIGEHGVLSAADTVELIKPYPLRFPTLFAFVEPTDAHIVQLAILGMASSLVGALCGWRIPLLVSWAIFLSLCTVGGEFFAYPWDSLLLEAGALAVLMGKEPDAFTCMATRFLVFRLQLGMGMQKFYGTGENDWWRGTYLNSFYVWQPMPTPAAWYVHNLGSRFHWYSTRVVLVSQLVMPFGIFGPRRVRRVCALVFVLEQVWIQLTGNYGIFNLLTIVLCMLPLTEEAPPFRASTSMLLAVPHMICGSFYLVRRTLVGLQTPEYPWLSTPTWLYEDNNAFKRLGTPLQPVFLIVVTVLRRIAPYRLCNDYGIFRKGLGDSNTKRVVRMLGRVKETKTFALLVLPTAFYQATSGILDVRPNNSLPAWFAPHQPRLDHSFYYAAINANIGEAVAYEQYHLRPLTHPQTFLRLVERALLKCRTDQRGSPVKDLFAVVPPNLDAIILRWETCKFANGPLRRQDSMWRCSHFWKHPNDFLAVKMDVEPSEQDMCTDRAWDGEAKKWLQQRKSALEHGLGLEAKLRQPPALSKAAVGTLAVLAVSRLFSAKL
jgi:hypothetical protein